MRAEVAGFEASGCVPPTPALARSKAPQFYPICVGKGSPLRLAALHAILLQPGRVLTFESSQENRQLTYGPKSRFVGL